MFFLTDLFYALVEPPVTFVRKMEDQRFPDGALISIECELSRHNVDVKWLKASTILNCLLLFVNMVYILESSIKKAIFCTLVLFGNRKKQTGVNLPSAFDISEWG